MTIEEVLKQLEGQRCEGADNPYGSIIRFDIGPLGRPPDEPEATPHGWRHLTIQSPWRLETANRVLGDWNTPGWPDHAISELIARLVGKVVLKAEASGPGWDLVLTWSDGTKLRVFSDSDEDGDDAWFILGTDGLELAAGPAKGEGPGWTIKLPQLRERGRDTKG